MIILQWKPAHRNAKRRLSGYTKTGWTRSRLSERDIHTTFITPSLRQAGWDEMTQLREEVSFTIGRIIVRGKLVAAERRRRVAKHAHAISTCSPRGGIGHGYESNGDLPSPRAPLSISDFCSLFCCPHHDSGFFWLCGFFLADFGSPPGRRP